jgi:hypothetical protein
MTFNYQLNEDDFAAAQACHLRNYLKKPTARILVAIGALMILSGAVVLVQALLAHNSRALLQIAPYTILVLVWLVWLTRMFSSGSMFRKQFRKIRSLQLPMQLLLTESELRYTSANGETTAAWHAIERWQECKLNFMLYTQPRLFFILPKRVMQPEEIAAMRELLARKLPKS